MKRIGLAVTLALLALVASEWIIGSAHAETAIIPPLTPIQEDDAVPEIAEVRKVYQRVTASDWQPAVAVKASVERGKSKNYPKADFFCKQIKGTADIQFASKLKPGTNVIEYARVTSIDCSSRPGAARMTGVFVWSGGEIWVGEVLAQNRGLSLDKGFLQNINKSIQVYRKSPTGVTELAAVAGPEGATLLTTDGSRLFGFNSVQTSVYSSEEISEPRVPSRLIIPGAGYIDGRSENMYGFVVGMAETKWLKPRWGLGGALYRGGEGYGVFYALDDSFRLIGPIYNRSYTFESGVPPKPDYPELSRNGTLLVDLTDRTGTLSRHFIYMAASEGCRKAGAGECDSIRVETRVPTFLGPPGLYTYNGVVDLAKAPDLSTMLPGKWAVDLGAEPSTWAQHFQKIGEPGPSAQWVQNKQAEWDEHYQRKLEKVEANWAFDDQFKADYLAAKNQQYADSYAKMQAQREADARRDAARAAAILGAFSDLGQSAIGAAEDLNQTRALVNRTNAASAGGAVAAYTPNVAAPLTEEQRQLIASRWGRSGGKSVASGSSGQSYSGTSVSGSSSTSGADEPKRFTQAEVRSIMTSLTFVTEDGSSYVTNGDYVQLQTVATDRFWSLDMVPLKDMEVTRFSASDNSWNMEGRGICTNYLDMRDTSAYGAKLAIDEGTGLPSLSVAPCTWNFVNFGASYDTYDFSAGPGMFGSAPK
jgi:hypothetical protein